MFPEKQPVFSIFYSGVGHETAGREQLHQALTSFAAVLLACLLLAGSGEGTLRRYWRRVHFFAVAGVMIALYGEVPDPGIGGYPLRDALLLGANTVVAWTVMGLAAAALLRPRR